MSKSVKIVFEETAQSYDIEIGSGLLEKCGERLKSVLPETAEKIAVVTNKKVFSLYGEEVIRSLKAAGFKAFVLKIGDGEKYKNLTTLEKALRFFGENKFKRSDAAIALGGGVVGDLTGFASAVYLRGIPFVQIPTTLLSMIDSSVGGKTGVNTDFGKNLIGAFYQPVGVIIDTNTLHSLPRRELTAGFCEAIKQGAISDKKLFSLTKDFLEKYPPAEFKKFFFDYEFSETIEELIAAQVSFKASVVRDDAKEDPKRTDARSRKILNFGHTAAHALEKITNYQYFKHGEAVGYGILIAAEISKKVANFDGNELNLLSDAVATAGRLPSCKDINPQKVFDALAFDKKNIGNNLQWILLKKIGKPFITGSDNISKATVLQSIKKIIKT